MYFTAAVMSMKVYDGSTKTTRTGKPSQHPNYYCIGALNVTLHALFNKRKER